MLIKDSNRTATQDGRGRTRLVALIPARAGSKRIKNKNIRHLGEHPLIAYTIALAQGAGIFSDVIVSPNCPHIADISRYYGAEVPFLRPAELARDTSPDIDWLRHCLTALQKLGREYDCFALLRPTSPFRPIAMLLRAWKQFQADGRADSLRAVEKCNQHPGKMWVVRNNRMFPLLPFESGNVPWHSTPYQALPTVYVQNASLEIAYTSLPLIYGSLAGETVLPFLTDAVEGFDLNYEYDWQLAEQMLSTKQVVLPTITQSPCPLIAA
jgi:N-acylneuraminate cytidylyltransferase